MSGQPQPLTHNPLAANTIDTSPRELGLQDDRADEVPAGSTSPKNRVKRVMEKTVDKLGRSLSGKASSAAARPTSPTSGSRSLFLLNRKDKGKDRQSPDDAEGHSFDSL